MRLFHTLVHPNENDEPTRTNFELPDSNFNTFFNSIADQLFNGKRSFIRITDRNAGSSTRFAALSTLGVSDDAALSDPGPLTLISPLAAI